MKKTAIIITLAAILCSFASCSRSEVINSNSGTAFLSDTTTSAAAKTETVTAVTTAAASEKNTTAASAAAAETPAPADDTNSDADLSGYWYADGDPDSEYIHITKDGKFTEYHNYYGAYIMCSGNVKREKDPESGSYVYCMYRDSGELYNKFADDGKKEKTDIYMDNSETSHYAKLFGEEGFVGDAKAAEKSFAGSWVYGRAILEISCNGGSEFTAQVTWSGGAAVHEIWQYPLTLENGRLVCKGSGKRYLVEFEEGNTEPTETVKSTDASAEFILEGNHLLWNDLMEQHHDPMLFGRM